MKGLVVKDLRGNDPEELRRTVRKLEEDLFKYRLKQNTNQLENTMLIRKTRRDIARIRTVLTEQARAGNPGNPGKKTQAAAQAAPAAKE